MLGPVITQQVLTLESDLQNRREWQALAHRYLRFTLR